ncbi:tyrosine-type recombinase/integrase [Phormidesmis sp. 146-33]
MKVQRIRLPESSQMSWLLLGDDWMPVEPVSRYIRYLENLQRSPNTIRSYLGHLKLYWEFLSDSHRDWQSVQLDDLAEFIHWLRYPLPKIMPLQPQTAVRTESTVNQALSVVYQFYEFYRRLGVAVALGTDRKALGSGAYKPFLFGIAAQPRMRAKLIKLKEPRHLPCCLTAQQVRQLTEACQRLRDQFLICLLYETGMRIGEALGLRHSDLISEGRNEIHVIPRTDNGNGARGKSKQERIIHVSQDLLRLYSCYLIEEYPETDCDYVFVNIWEGKVGHPLSMSTVNSLFQRLSQKTAFKVHPHLLRHTHATELIRAGWNLAYVQKRLGHASIQTTLDTYVHLLDEDLRAAFTTFHQEAHPHDIPPPPTS